MGDETVRHEDDPELHPESLALLRAERDAEVAELRERADHLERISPEQYLGRGLYLGTVRNFELAGRMAKASFDAIEYMFGKPGWRVYSGNSEYYVPKDRIAAVFATENKRVDPKGDGNG